MHGHCPRAFILHAVTPSSDAPPVAPRFTVHAGGLQYLVTPLTAPLAPLPVHVLVIQPRRIYLQCPCLVNASAVPPVRQVPSGSGALGRPFTFKGRLHSHTFMHHQCPAYLQSSGGTGDILGMLCIGRAAATVYIRLPLKGMYPHCARFQAYMQHRPPPPK